MPDLETAQKFAAAYTAAWNTGKPEAVAAHYASDGEIVINAGKPWQGTAGLTAMAAGFYGDVPDLALVCDGLRQAGDHVVYLWTFTGTHAGSGKKIRVSGWEEWDFAPTGKIQRSRGWYDAADYARQTALP